MEKYSGNQKGFIYASCAAKDQEKVFDKYLEPLAHEGISFCWGDAYNVKEEGFIAKSNAVMLFLTKDYVREEKLRKTVEAAVKHDKPILSVYLEDVELDAGLSMQIESQQAMFVSRYKSDEEFVDDLKKAAVFDRIEVTGQQKKKQKRRVLAAVAVALAAVAVLAIALKPMLSSRSDDETLKALGLQGLSKSDLESIEMLYVIGTEAIIVDQDEDEIPLYRARYDDGNTDRIIIEEEGDIGTAANGSISDITVIGQMTNLRALMLAGQQIEDITPILKLKNLEYLNLTGNPVSSLDGIEDLSNLRLLDISFTNVEELPEGVHLSEVQAKSAKLKKIPDFGGLSDVGFDSTGDTPVTDVSNIGTAASYNYICMMCQDVKAEDIAKGLKGIPVKYHLGLLNIQIDSLEELVDINTEELIRFEINDSSISSLDGIEHFEGIEEMSLTGCSRLTDISPVNRLKSLKKLRITRDMEDLAAAVDDRIEIEYED